MSWINPRIEKKGGERERKQEPIFFKIRRPRRGGACVKKKKPRVGKISGKQWIGESDGRVRGHGQRYERIVQSRGKKRMDGKKIDGRGRNVGGNSEKTPRNVGCQVVGYRGDGTPE